MFSLASLDLLYSGAGCVLNLLLFLYLIPNVFLPELPEQNHNLIYFFETYDTRLLQVGADDTATLDKIIDSLTSLANAHGGDDDARKETELALKIGKVNECGTGDTVDKDGPKILILGAGRVCRPAAQFLASYPNICSYGADDNSTDQIHVIVASLYQKDAEEVILASMHSPTLENIFPTVWLVAWLAISMLYRHQ